MDTIKAGNLSKDTYAELERTLVKIDTELKYNEKRRDSVQSETASSAFSRLIKDLLVQRSAVTATLAELRSNDKEIRRITYEIRIGDFKEATPDSIQKKNLKKEELKDATE
jgi:hypothetical protein